MRSGKFDQDTVDVVFVVDTTGSMMRRCSALLLSLHNFIDGISQAITDCRFAVVSFGDLTVAGDKIEATEFTTNNGQIKTDLQNMPRFNGGNNVGESALDAVQYSANLPFRQIAAKIVVLLTDEPPLPSLPIQLVVSHLLEKQITAIVVSPSNDGYLEIAQKTGGFWQEIRSLDLPIDKSVELIRKLLSSRRRLLPVAPPPPLLRKFVFILGVLITLAVGAIALALLNLLPGEFMFPSQMISLTVGACLMPTLASKLAGPQNRVLRIVLEALFLSSLFVGFGFWLLGSQTGWIWVLYVISIILILEIGSHLVDRYAIMTVKRVFRSNGLKNMLSDAETAKILLHKELIFYAAFPLGMVIGTVWGFANKLPIPETTLLCILAVFTAASVILILSLITTFVRMIEPLFRENKEPPENVDNFTEAKGFFSYIRSLVGLTARKPFDEKALQEKQDLSTAIMATDLRKIYLYDAAHNVTLLFAFGFSGASLANFSLDAKWTALSLLGLSLVFVQLPYMIGQSLLQEKVLDKYEGTERIDILEKLRKDAPLFPTIDFLTALSATGTAGGLLYYILDNLLKGILK